MEHLGSLIRRLRLERRLSQAALCRGICAVSYLSKIEKGIAHSGEEIIKLLFSALGVDFQMDEAFLRETRRALDAYFEHTCFMEPRDTDRAALLPLRERVLQSPLTDDFTLFLAYDALEEGLTEQAKALLDSLNYREAEMEENALFFYSLARGMALDTLEEGLSWLEKANRLRPCASAAFRSGELYHQHGQYQPAIDHLQIAYARAAEEGSPMILLLASNLMAICHSDLYQEELMLRYFHKARRLALFIEPSMLSQIDYNIGATLVSMRKSKEAIPYLKSAGTGAYDSKLLLYHKLIIACFDTGDRKAARQYLRKADALIKAGKGSPMEEKLIRIAGMRLEEGYLASEEYIALLEEVYGQIGAVYHHGFRQFQGNLLVEALVHNRRYKEALRIASEVGVFPDFIK